MKVNVKKSIVLAISFILFVILSIIFILFGKPVANGRKRKKKSKHA